MSIGVGDGERARARHRRDRPRPRVHADAADVRADPRVRLVAAFDPRVEAMARAQADFGARDHASVESLCADPAVDVVYVASPHQHHAAHVAAAAAGGKHVLVEKPMAVTLAEARAMIDAAARAGVHLVVGHSHSFDRPILRAREIIASGAVGALRMITAQYHTDFLYRPRRPEELDTAQGGGAVFNQAAHQVDIVRLLAGGEATSVRALTGRWDPARPTEGAYAALVTFADGTFASLVYGGYAHFDGDELCGGATELGGRQDPARYGAARRRLAGVPDAQEEAAAQGRAQLRRRRVSGFVGDLAGRRRAAPALRVRARLVRARRSSSAARGRDDLRRCGGHARSVAAASRAAGRGRRRALRRGRARTSAAARRTLGHGDPRGVHCDAGLGPRGPRRRASRPGRA